MNSISGFNVRKNLFFLAKNTGQKYYRFRSGCVLIQKIVRERGVDNKETEIAAWRPLHLSSKRKKEMSKPKMIIEVKGRI